MALACSALVYIELLIPISALAREGTSYGDAPAIAFDARHISKFVNDTIHHIENNVAVSQIVSFFSPG
eukprot:gene1708-biopygen7371